MPIVKLKEVPKLQFPNGATYQTIVGDEAGSTPVRVGVQVSPPGYSTGTHSHPYMEIVSIIEGEGEAWMDGTEGVIAIGRLCRHNCFARVAFANLEIMEVRKSNCCSVYQKGS